MIIFKHSADLITYLLPKKAKGLPVSFVPTMGALHEGHIQLLKKARSNNGITVCSIFVNPTQFNDPEDFKKYPVTIETDIQQLETNGVDILFLPTIAEMYPHGTESDSYELGDLENILEGKFRPGHFQGVCQVVDRLLSIVQPDQLFMGQKDFQQCMVVDHLLKLKHHDVSLQVVPTLREADGLAMSSRNVRLSPQARQHATILYKTLSHIAAAISTESFEKLTTAGKQIILNEGFSAIDYLEICEPSTLHAATTFKKRHGYVILVAAFIDGVRLIDNIVVESPA
jgi:pantoate--beta-alanine ligase